MSRDFEDITDDIASQISTLIEGVEDDLEKLLTDEEKDSIIADFLSDFEEEEEIDFVGNSYQECSISSGICINCGGKGGKPGPCPGAKRGGDKGGLPPAPKNLTAKQKFDRSELASQFNDLAKKAGDSGNLSRDQAKMKDLQKQISAIDATAKGKSKIKAPADKAAKVTEKVKATQVKVSKLKAELKTVKAELKEVKKAVKSKVSKARPALKKMKPGDDPLAALNEALAHPFPTRFPK